MGCPCRAAPGKKPLEKNPISEQNMSCTAGIMGKLQAMTDQRRRLGPHTQWFCAPLRAAVTAWPTVTHQTHLRACNNYAVACM